MWGKLHAEGGDHLMLIDGGASISTIPMSAYQALPVNTRPPLVDELTPIAGFTKDVVHSRQVVELTVNIENMEMKQWFRVCKGDAMVVLGGDFIAKYQVVPLTHKNQVFLGGQNMKIFDYRGVPIRHKVVVAAMTTIPAGRRVVIAGKVKGRGNINGRTVVMEPAVKIRHSSCGLAMPKVVTKPFDGKTFVELYNTSNVDIILQQGDSLGVLRQVNAVQKYHENGLVPNPTSGERPVGDPPSYNDLDSTAGSQSVDDSDLTAGSESVESDQPNTSNIPGPAHVNRITVEERGPEVPPHLQEMYEKNSDGLSGEDDKAFRHLLVNYGDVFAKTKMDLGKCTLVKHHIDTGDARPLKARPRRLPQAHFDEMSTQVRKLEANGIIKAADSEWGANVILVKKKDNTWRMCVDYRDLNSKTTNVDPYLIPRIDDTIDALGGAKFFCTLDLIQGYHQIEMTEESKAKTAFVVPRMTPSQWQYNFMPFGVTGGPATFQRVMDRILSGLEHKIALAYLDDVIVYGQTAAVCIVNLEKVLVRIEEAGLKLKPAKCEFFKKELLYLGHIVSADGIKCDPAKIEAIKRWIEPRTSRQIKVFLGTANYYNRFIKDYSAKAFPLYQLARKGRKFKWENEHQKGFDEIRKSLIEAPVMAYPLDEGLYILDTDASGYAIGGVLSQLQPNEEGVDEEKVISYGSKALQPREQRYCTRRRELLAIVHFVKVFRAYLYGRRVLIRTDHASLKYIKTLKDPNDQFSRWFERLEETNYEIEIRAGVKHGNADGLSRLETDVIGVTHPHPGRVDWSCLPCEGKKCICEGVNELEAKGDTDDNFTILSANHDENTCNGHREAARVNCKVVRHEMTVDEPRVRVAARQVQPMVAATITFEQIWEPEEMKIAQSTDPDIAMLYEAKRDGLPKPTLLQVSAASEALIMYWHEWKRLELVDGLLYRRWEARDGGHHYMQLVLPFAYQEKMCAAFHDSDAAAHMGKRRTFNQVHRRMFWYRMGEDIKFWIKTCDICQRRKRPGKTPLAPKKIYTTGNVCQRVCLDICGPLAMTPRKNQYILVVMDQYSKYTRAFALPNQTAQTIADVFHKEWVCLLGAPREVHTDQGRNFDGVVFNQLCELFKSAKTRTTAYHASANGGVERFNHTMCNMLSALAEHDRKSWDDKLAYACQAYNSTRHDTTGMEPNLLMFGRQPDLPWDVMVPSRPDCEPLLQHEYIRKVKRDMRRIHQLAREKAGRAATVIKRYNDRKSHLNLYQVGDLVMLRSYKIVPGLNKLTDNYEGPVFIIDVISDITFRVAKDARSKAKIVHHDRLKPYCIRTAAQNDNQWVFDYAKVYKRRSPEEVIQIQIADGILSTEITEPDAVLNAPSSSATVTTGVNVEAEAATPVINELAVTVTTETNIAPTEANISDEITSIKTTIAAKSSTALSELKVNKPVPLFTSTPKVNNVNPIGVGAKQRINRLLPFSQDVNQNLISDSDRGIKQTSPARVAAPATVLQGTMSANKALVCTGYNTEIESATDTDSTCSRSESDMSVGSDDSPTGEKQQKYARRDSPLKDTTLTYVRRSTPRGGGGANKNIR